MSEPERFSQTEPSAKTLVDASQDRGFLDPGRWRELIQAESAESFAFAWLELQCALIGGVEQGVVVLGQPEEGPFAPLVYWPRDTEVSPNLTAVCEAAMAERRGVLRTGKQRGGGDPGWAVVALPLLVAEKLHGVAAVEIKPRPKPDVGSAMRHLQWGTAWLEKLVLDRSIITCDQRDAVLEVVATSLEHAEFQAAATAVATDLATRLGCDRVSIGFRHGAHTHVRALSHSAEFGKKTNLIRSLGAVMDEAEDQQAAIVFPAPANAPPRVTQAHAELARLHGAEVVCTVPLSENGRLIGGLTLERGGERPFEDHEVELCENVGVVVGPILETKRRDDRWLVVKARDSGLQLVRNLIGPRHVGLKLLVMAMIVVGVFFTYATGPYRITSDATLEGTVQRAVTAPIRGYIAETYVRAGDLVETGQLMATLDEKELALERIRWVSHKEQRLREYSQALAENDRARVGILGAQIAQAEAQLELIDGQLQRTRILAPFSGIVVTGDLSQSLSAPVERGEVLFEVAPLNNYRVILDIDEREITQLEVGQSGQLALAGLPGESLVFVVRKITPVSTPAEGRNYFRVEASLETTSELLRPGMEGIGKVDVDTRRIVWIYTHKLIQSLRMRFWSWWF